MQKSFEIDGNEFWVVQDSGKVRICTDKEEALMYFIGGGFATCASIKINEEGIEVAPLSPMEESNIRKEMLDFNSQEEIPIDRELLDKLCEYGDIEIIHNGVHYYAGNDHTIFVQAEENFKVGIQSDIQINIHRK